MKRYMVEKLKYTEEELQRLKVEGERHWVVVFSGGDEYDVHGTFGDVQKLCDEVGSHPVYASCEYDYPVKVSEWELMKQLKVV